MNKRPLKMSNVQYIAFVYHNEEYLFGFGWCIMDFL